MTLDRFDDEPTISYSPLENDPNLARIHDRLISEYANGPRQPPDESCAPPWVDDFEPDPEPEELDEMMDVQL